MWFWRYFDAGTGRSLQSSHLFHTVEDCMADARTYGFTGAMGRPREIAERAR
jgi:hypothetical protein